MKRARAFTLIEIAVVLFIIALLAGTIAQYLSGQIASAKQQLTQTRETAIKTAIISFVARNYHTGGCDRYGSVGESGFARGNFARRLRQPVHLSGHASRDVQCVERTDAARLERQHHDPQRRPCITREPDQ